MFSARVPLVRALEHCNINDTEIESSRGAVEGKERAYRATYRPSFHRSRRERERDDGVRPLGNIHFRGRLESSLPSRIICNLFFRGLIARRRVCVHRWHRNRRCQSPLWDNVNRSERKIVFALPIRTNSFARYACINFQTTPLRFLNYVGYSITIKFVEYLVRFDRRVGFVSRWNARVRVPEVAVRWYEKLGRKRKLWRRKKPSPRTVLYRDGDESTRYTAESIDSL